MKNKFCLIILGMHRSGTSAITGALSKFKYDLGSDLMVGNEYNERGYFENSKVVEINSDFINQFGGNWSSPFLMPWKFRSSVQNKKFIHRITEFIENEFQDHDRFMLKDPRFCLTMPIWIEAFQQLQIKYKFIYCVRDPEEVIRSLIKRDRFSFDYAKNIFYQYVFRAIYYLSDKDVFFLDFNTLLNNPVKSLNKILNEFLDVGEAKSDRKESELLDFISNKLHHEQKSESRLSSLSLLYEIYDLIKKGNKRSLTKCLHISRYFKKSTDFSSNLQAPEIPYSENFAQLYFRSNNEFKEQESMKSSIKYGINNLRFQYTGKNEITSIRFDPSNSPVVIYNLNVIGIVSGKKFRIEPITDNSTSKNKIKYLFGKEDPNLIFNLEELKTKSITILIHFCISKLGKEDVELFQHSMNIYQEDETLFQLVKEYRDTIDKINELQNEIRLKKRECKKLISQNKELNSNISIYSTELKKNKIQLEKFESRFKNILIQLSE